MVEMVMTIRGMLKLKIQQLNKGNGPLQSIVVARSFKKDKDKDRVHLIIHHGKSAYFLKLEVTRTPAGPLITDIGFGDDANDLFGK
jgi:hypothetical protein